jgi:hypothetical protein
MKWWALKRLWGINLPLAITDQLTGKKSTGGDLSSEDNIG